MNSRAKGLSGEREVAALFEAQGFMVRGLESRGDHLVIVARRTEPRLASSLVLHSEVKRAERLRLHEWIKQAEYECPASAIPLLTFRRSREPWRSVIRTEDLLRLIA